MPLLSCRLVYAKLKLPEEGCEETGKSKGKNKRTAAAAKEYISLAIELVKLLTAIVALITAILLFLTENGLI